MKIYIYQSDIGKLGIAADEEGITNIYIAGDSFPENIESIQIKNAEDMPLIAQAKLQLDEYFAGLRMQFSLPLNPAGTPYMKKVWNCLCEIPYGQTATYGDIARKSGNAKAARAVGMANNRNPIPIVVPCHRVIGANGKLVGYRGGVDMKQKLLALEKNNSHS